MESTKHRTTLGKRVMCSALAGIVALAAAYINPFRVSASETKTFYEEYEGIVEESIIEITWDEYSKLLRMTMAEVGYCSEDMMNGCASAAINQCIRNECTLQETLETPGAFCYKFRDLEGKWRTVELSDVNTTVVDAVNDALLGNDVTSEIGGAIGFYAPKSCSEEKAKYMYDHTSGGETMQIENVVFFSEWKIDI